MDSPTDIERRRKQGLAALVFVQVCFGLFPIFVKQAYSDGEGFAPRSLAAWRMGVGALVLGGAALLAGHGRRVPAAADLGRFALCTLCGIVGNQVFALEGVRRTSVVQAGLLMTLIPVFTYGLALLARQETYRGRRVAGIAVAMGGVVLLVLARHAGVDPHAEDPVVGGLLIVTNCFLYAVYLILARPLLARYSALVVIGWSYLLALVCVPLVLVGVEPWPADPGATVVLGWAYTLIFPTVLAYLVNTWALARVSASTTAAFIYLQPFVAGFAAVTVRGEHVAPRALIAALLIFAGLGLVVYAPAVRRPG